MLEAVLKQARTTRHAWLIACDANMCPEDFERKSLVPIGADACGGPERSIYVQVERPKKMSGSKETVDCVIACNSLRGTISQVEVVEDFESRPHKAVSFVVVRREEMKEWNEQKLPKVLRGKRGRRRKKDQGSNRSRSGCRHQKEGKRA